MSAEIHFTDDTYEPYEQVRLLDNGWLKATEAAGGSIYYPPGDIAYVCGSRVHVGNGDQV